MHFEGLDESVRKESGDIYKTRKEKSTHIALVDRGDKNPQFHHDNEFSKTLHILLKESSIIT